MRETKTLTDAELIERLRRLTRALPPSSELRRMLMNLDDPANDEASKDRYVALVSGGAVEEGLRIAISRALEIDAADGVFFGGKLGSFGGRIKKAETLGLVAPEETQELDRIRQVRNAFAHSLTPVSFEHPDIAEMTKRLWHHPVTSWSGYFAPAFEPRHQFAIVCGEFYENLARPNPVTARGVGRGEPNGGG